MISVGHMGNLCLSDEIPYSIQIWESVETLDPHVEQGGLKTQDRHFSYVGHMWTICSIYFQYAGHMWTIHCIQQICRRKFMCEKHMATWAGNLGCLVPSYSEPHSTHISHRATCHMETMFLTCGPYTWIRMFIVQ